MTGGKLGSRSLASSRLARHARICHDGCHPTSGQQAGAQKNKVECNATSSDLIRWSIQEIRRMPNVSRENEFNPPTSSHGRSGAGLIKPQHRNPISKNYNCNARPGRVDGFSQV